MYYFIFSYQKYGMIYAYHFTNKLLTLIFLFTKRSVSTSRKTTTLIHVYNTKEFIQTNSIKTDTPDPEFYFFISIFLIITIVVLVMCGYRKELSKRCKQVRIILVYQ